MRAELIIDLSDVGDDIGRARGRDVPVFPALGNVAELWARLGVTVTAIHVAAPGPDTTAGKDSTFDELHIDAWWKTETVFIEDQDFIATLSRCPSGSSGPVGLHELVTTLALHASDELAKYKDEPSMVIVMSNSSDVAPAVSHARGVPVMIAGTIIPDSGLAHARLDLSWMGLLKDRFASIKLHDVELRDGRPWSNDVAVCTPFEGTEGRDMRVAVLPSFAESVALFDPECFHLHDNGSQPSPDDAGLASVIHTLGLGTLVHVDDVSTHVRSRAKSLIAASLYRYASDHPDLPIVVASTRPSIIALTSDLDTYRIANPSRVLRLCLPQREHNFDERGYASSSAACRIVIERTLAEPLFGEDETVDDVADGPELTLIEGGADSEPIDVPERAISPTLVLYANPNTIREASGEWRQETQRRFLLLGANGAEATPADTNDGVFLPLSLGGCTDFALRRPALRPGCVVEGVLNRAGDRWIVVSDPIERRRQRRVENETVDAA